MNNRKLLVAIIVTLTLLGTAGAVDFTLTANTQSQNTCAGDTLVYVLNVQNTAGSSGEFTISKGGDAASWALVAPSGFSLKPSSSKGVYVYVTPPQDASSGSHFLTVTVSSGSTTQSQSLSVIVDDCRSVSVSSSSTSQDVCLGNPAVYTATVRNTGAFTDTFDLSLGGFSSNKASLSEESLRLTAGESRTATATVQSDNTGIYDVTLTAKARDSDAVSSTSFKTTVNECFGFDVIPEKDYVSFCESFEARVPITIENTGSQANTFRFELTRKPGWASLEESSVSLGPGQSRAVDLIFFPGYGLAGTDYVDLKVTPENGAIIRKTITANVLSCHKTVLDFQEEEVSLCPGEIRAVEARLANAGEFDEHYTFDLQGPSWAAADISFVDLSPQHDRTVNVLLNSANVRPGDYDLRLTATSQNEAKSSDSDSLKINVNSEEQCYAVDISAVSSSNNVEIGGTTLVPLTITNKGSETATYNLILAGSGSQYAQINPASATLEAGESEDVFVHFAAPEGETGFGYSIIAVASREDGEASSTASFTINIVEDGGLSPVNGGETKIDYDLAAGLRKYFNKLTGAFAVEDTEKAGVFAGLVKFKSQFSPDANYRWEDRAKSAGRFIIRQADRAGLGDEVGRLFSHAGKGYRFAREHSARDTYGLDNRVWILAVILLLIALWWVWKLVEEEDEQPPETSSQQTEAPAIPPVTESVKKETEGGERKSAWKRFMDWLEEEEPGTSRQLPEASSQEKEVKAELPAEPPKLKPAPGTEAEKKGLWKRFMDWLEEEEKEKPGTSSQPPEATPPVTGSGEREAESETQPKLVQLGKPEAEHRVKRARASRGKEETKTE